MRCPDCNKFVGLETQEPEENSTDFDPETGAVAAEYRIVRCCSDCGNELKEATIEFADEFDPEFIAAHQGEGHALNADFLAELIEEGGERYKKSYYGVSLCIDVTCNCGASDSLTLSDKIAASEMDELA